jgi:hypothetical protein
VAHPAFDPAIVEQLAKVLAAIALEELISELRTENAAHPRAGETRRSEDFDGRDDTTLPAA